MIKPTHLQGEAAKFWTRNAKRLQDAGILNDDSFDGFVLLCETWGHRAEADPKSKDPKERIWYVALNKQCQALLKQYGLLPRDRKRCDMEPEQDIGQVLQGKMEKRAN